MPQRPEFFSYHKAALHALRNQLPLPTMQDGQPQGGYYFIRKIKDGPKLPVAIFEDDGGYREPEIIVTVDGYPIHPSEHNKTWLICARHPVPWEAYEARLETGAWPGERAPEPAAAGEGHNAPPPGEDLSPRGEGEGQGEGTPIGPEPQPSADIILAREIDAAKAWLETTTIDSDERADEAATRVAEIRRLKALVAELHRSEKAPHQAKCDEIDDKYLPLIRETAKDPRNVGRAVLAINFLLGKITAFWAKKKEDERAAAAKAAEVERQAAELKRMADAAIASAQKSNAVQGSPPPADLPATPTTPPPLAVPPPPSRQAAGGVVGKRVTSRTKIIAVIDDQDAVYQHFRDNAQVKALLLKLAQTMIDAKQPVPGVSTKEEEFAR